MTDIYDVILVQDTKREIYSFLTAYDVMKLKYVNKKFQNSVDDGIVWKGLCKYHWGLDVEISKSQETFLEKARSTMNFLVDIQSTMPDNVFDEKVNKQKAKLTFKGRVGIPYRPGLADFGDIEGYSYSLIFEHFCPVKLSERDLKAIKLRFAFLIYDGSYGKFGSEIIKEVKKEFGDDGVKLYDYESVRKSCLENNPDCGPSDLDRLMVEYFDKHSHTDALLKFARFVGSNERIWSLVEKSFSRRGEHKKIGSVECTYDEGAGKVFVYFNFVGVADPLEHLFKKKAKDGNWGRVAQLKWVAGGVLFWPLAKQVKKLKKCVKNFRSAQPKDLSAKVEMKMKWRTFLNEIHFESLAFVGTDLPTERNREYDDLDEDLLDSKFFFLLRVLPGKITSFIIKNKRGEQIVFNLNTNYPLVDHVFHYTISSKYTTVSSCVAAMVKERENDIRLEDELEEEFKKHGI